MLIFGFSFFTVFKPDKFGLSYYLENYQKKSSIYFNIIKKI